ncbi:hypothetical protein OE766_08490 [Pararhizobium sp. YC-54]|nr:hypothetical protein [Pararhizobium sp. YC-54]MCV9998283.1 hypothetical protein [Pararhizobium sp. YC-54]
MTPDGNTDGLHLGAISISLDGRMLLSARAAGGPVVMIGEDIGR